MASEDPSSGPEQAWAYKTPLSHSVLPDVEHPAGPAVDKSLHRPSPRDPTSQRRQSSGGASAADALAAEKRRKRLIRNRIDASIVKLADKDENVLSILRILDQNQQGQAGPPLVSGARNGAVSFTPQALVVAFQAIDMPVTEVMVDEAIKELQGSSMDGTIDFFDLYQAILKVRQEQMKKHKHSDSARKQTPSSRKQSLLQQFHTISKGGSIRRRGGESREILARSLSVSASFDEARYRDRLESLKHTTLMLQPQGSVRVGWDMLIMAVLLYLLISMPYRIGFDAAAEGGAYYVEKVMNYMFWVDIALNFRTGYLEGGVTVMNWKKVAKHYLLGWFVIDVIASFPYDEILEGDQSELKSSKFFKSSKVAKVLKLFKLLRLSKIAKSSVYLEILEDWFSLNSSVLEASKLLFVYFILAHFVACLWAFIGRLSIDDRNDGDLLASPPWWEVYSRRDGLAVDGQSSWDSWSTGEQYLTALYFAVSSIATMGYGDIVPISHAERAYVMILDIIGSGFYALVIANVSTLVGNLDSNGRMFNEKMGGLQFYLTAKKIPADLSFKIRKHFKQQLLSRRAMDEIDILSNLPVPLKVELSAFLIDGKLLKLPIFADLKSDSLLTVFQLMKTVEFREGAIVARQGDAALTAFILLYGEMVLMRENGEVLYVMKVGDMFGELSVLRVELVRGCSVICRTACECYVLESADLFDAFEDNEEEMEKMLVGAVRNALETYRASRKLAVLEDKLHEVYLRRQQRQAQLDEAGVSAVGLFTMSTRARKFLFPNLWRAWRVWRLHFKYVRLSTRLIQRIARRYIGLGAGKRRPLSTTQSDDSVVLPLHGLFTTPREVAVAMDEPTSSLLQVASVDATKIVVQLERMQKQMDTLTTRVDAQLKSQRESMTAATRGLVELLESMKGRND